MNSTDYEVSTAWSTLDDLAQVLDASLEPSTDDEREAVRRIHAVVEHSQAYRGCEPALVEPGALDEVAQHLGTILNGLNQYNRDREANRAHLTAAANPARDLMNSLRTHFPPPGADAATQATMASSTRYKNEIDAQVAALRETVQNLQEQLEASQTARQEAETAANQRLDEFKSAIDEQQTRNSELNDTLESQIKTQAQSFTSEAESREESYRTKEKTRDEEHAERLKKLEEEASAARKAEAVKAEEILAQLRKYQEQSKAVIDSTSRHAVSGQYGTWAAHQARAAFRWTLAAVFIGLGVVGGLIWEMSTASSDTAQFVAYKISTGLLAAAVAGYAAKQAAEHRVQERRFKRLALDVAALEPFLATLDDPVTIRSEFAKRVFVPNESLAEDKTTLESGTTISLSVKEMLELLKGLRK